MMSKKENWKETKTNILKAIECPMLLPFQAHFLNPFHARHLTQIEAARMEVWPWCYLA